MPHFQSLSSSIKKLKAGDPETWNRRCDDFRMGLTASARRWIDRSAGSIDVDADDLVSISIQKAWKSCESFKGDSTVSFAAWLLTIMKNTLRDKLKAKVVSPGDWSSWMEPEARQRSPFSELVSAESEAMLHASVAQLKSEYREVIVLRYLDGLTLQQTAERLGIARTVVAGRDKRGMEKLTQLLQECLGKE